MVLTIFIVSYFFEFYDKTEIFAEEDFKLL